MPVNFNVASFNVGLFYIFVDGRVARNLILF